MSNRTGGKAKKLPANLFSNDFGPSVFISTQHPSFPREEATILADCTADNPCGLHGDGGAGRDRTDDILLAKQALSQLSYGP